MIKIFKNLTCISNILYLLPIKSHEKPTLEETQLNKQLKVKFPQHKLHYFRNIVGVTSFSVSF